MVILPPLQYCCPMRMHCPHMPSAGPVYCAFCIFSSAEPIFTCRLLNRSLWNACAIRTTHVRAGSYYLVILNTPALERHRQRSLLRVRSGDYETSRPPDNKIAYNFKLMQPVCHFMNGRPSV